MSRVVTVAPCVPVLKWIGGKSGLLETLGSRWPRGVAYRRHVEPFFGGGAVFFARAPRAALLADSNPGLVRMYAVLRDDAAGVVRCLVELAQAHGRDAEATYYAARDRMNAGIVSGVEHAATFVYLNRASFNGLHRVNAAGQFNAPRGDTRARALVDVERLRTTARALVGAELRCGDFDAVLGECLPGDFVYLDPPYLPAEEGSFTAYAGTFGVAEHRRLRATWGRLDALGCVMMQSNADVPAVRELYSGYRIEAVVAPRSVGAGRGAATAREVLIRNY